MKSAGERLYEIYVESMAAQGIEVDDWNLLMPTEQRAWEEAADLFLEQFRD
jgi:hypothetical protein